MAVASDAMRRSTCLSFYADGLTWSFARELIEIASITARKLNGNIRGISRRREKTTCANCGAWHRAELQEHQPRKSVKLCNKREVAVES